MDLNINTENIEADFDVAEWIQENVLANEGFKELKNAYKKNYPHIIWVLKALQN